jgi:hypothetical protein
MPSFLISKMIRFQKSSLHQLIHGERSGEITPQIEKLKVVFEGANASFELSEQINQEMWHKYLFITALSGITSLMKSPIGPIMELETGRNTVASPLEELGAVMKKIDAPIRDTITQELYPQISRNYSPFDSPFLLCPRMTAFITQLYSICGQIIHTHTDHFWIFSKNISVGLIFHHQFGNT